MSAKRDWQELREKYVQGDISLAKLSKETGVPRTSMFHHSTKEGWVEARMNYRSDVVAKTRLLGANRAAKDKLNTLKEAERTCEVLSSAIAAIAQTVEDRGFADKVGKIQSNKILERLSSISVAQDKILRVIQLLNGAPDSRPAVDLASLLSGPSE